eukprot:12258941-Alexandrium_andersonii.AAC.1
MAARAERLGMVSDTPPPRSPRGVSRPHSPPAPKRSIPARAGDRSEMPGGGSCGEIGARARRK